MKVSDTIATFRQALRGAQSEIDSLRTKIEDLGEQRRHVESVPRSRAEFESILDHWIAEAQARKPFTASALWSIHARPHEALAAINGSVSSAPFDILAAWDGDKLKRLMLEEAPVGMSEAERRKSLARIDAEIEAVEVAEELACRALEAETGITTLRRADDLNLAILLAPDAELEGKRR